jgi:hypothetical protein
MFTFQIIRLLTKSKAHNIHWKVYSYSSGKKLPVFIEQNKLLPCLQKHASLIWFTPRFISFCSLSYDRSVASSQASSPLSAI